MPRPPSRSTRSKGRSSSKKGEPKQRRPKKQSGKWKDTAYRTTVKSKMPLVMPLRTSTSKAAPTVAPTTAAPIAPITAEPGKERLQKVLARAGIASRRKAEILIVEGAVTVNGRIVTELGTKVDSKKDKIKVNGKLIYSEVDPLYIALNKPRGVISSLSDPEGRPHLGILLKGIPERVIPIGRLDFNSEGLMLLTNDGDLAEKVVKARGLPRIYMVKVKGHPTSEDLEFLKKGLFTAEGVVRFASFGVEQTLKNKSWIKLEVTEGAKLDLRELLNHRGLLVDRIVRTAIGTLSIKGLEAGEYRFLKRQDLETLLKLT